MKLIQSQNLLSPFMAACALVALSGCTVEVAEPDEADAVQGASALEYSPPSGWNLAWSDEFDGNSLNGANWTTLNSNWDPVTNNCNFGTGELEYPRAQNVTVSGGRLILTAERTSDNPNDAKCAGYGPRSFYSGRIHTKGKVERKFGKIMASIKVPSGYGIWPAFWTLGANVSQVGWPSSGEIDILEWHSNEPTWMKSANHWLNDKNFQADWGTGASGGYNLADSFHIYEVEWTASQMVFRLDNKYVGTTYYHNETEFQQNHYIILNLALGGNWYGNTSAANVALSGNQKKTMEVEWVRWYQQGGGGGGGGGGNVGVANAGFESGLNNWATWSPNGTAGAALSETYNGGHSGSYHLTHWTSGAPFEAWTYQSVSGLASGNYKVRAWVRKGGNFNLSRLQAKTSAGGAPTYVDLGTYGNWTLVETPAINVSGGYLEFGFHSNSPAGNGANFIHMDDVELIKL